MKHIMVKGLNILSIVLLCCTLLCGAWVATHEMSDMHFHAVFSCVSIIIALISQIVNLLKRKFCSGKN